MDLHAEAYTITSTRGDRGSQERKRRKAGDLGACACTQSGAMTGSVLSGFVILHRSSLRGGDDDRRGGNRRCRRRRRCDSLPRFLLGFPPFSSCFRLRRPVVRDATGMPASPFPHPDVSIVVVASCFVHRRSPRLLRSSRRAPTLSAKSHSCDLVVDEITWSPRNGRHVTRLTTSSN